MNDEQPPPAADADVMQTWATHLYAERPGLLSVCSDADGWAGRRFTTDPAGIKAAVKYAMTLDRRRPNGIYAQVTTLREHPAEGRGGEDLAYCVTHLWADGDYGTIGHKPGPDDLPAPPDAEAVAKVVAESGLPEPSGWVFTGGGYNPVWMLAEPYVIGDDEDRARVKELTTTWQAILAAQAHRCGWSWDSDVGNLDRLMKLPGSVNRKEGLERPTGIGPGSGVLYDLETLTDAAARLAPEARTTMEQASREKQERKAARLGQKVPPPRSPRTPRPSTGDGPLDVLADVWEFRDVLEPAGFTYQGQHGDGRERWRRPAGADGPASSTYSLLCDDHVAVNWSERSDLPVGAQPPGSKLTVGTLYAHLNYGGNTSEAARDIMRAAAGRSAGIAAQLPPAVLAEVKRRCLADTPARHGFEGLRPPESDTEPPYEEPLYEEDGTPEREPIPRTWQAQDLEDVLSGSYRPPRPTVGHRDDGVGLFYPGRVNTIICETEGGKTWLACVAAIQEMNAGNHVVYLDFEDDRGGMVSRLLVLGAAPDVIRRYFHYVRPENRPTPADLADLAQLLALAPTLAVIDGITEAMSLYGQEINDNNGAAAFGRELLRPIKNSGAAVVTLDHVVKDSEKRGRYAIGAVHKLNGLDGVQYTMENIQPFGIGLTGRTRVRIAKDRPAQIRRHAVHSDKHALRWFMDMVITSHDESFAEAFLYPPLQQQDPDDTAVEQEKAAKEEAEIKEREAKVLGILARAKEPLSGKAIEDLVPGRASITRRALTRLVHAGNVTASAGARGATLHSLADEDGGES